MARPATRKRAAAVDRKRPAAKRPTDRDAESADPRLAKRVDELLRTEIAFISNDGFVGRRADQESLSPFAERVEQGLTPIDTSQAAGLPSHLASLCATPLLSSEQEQELFRRMNFCKYRANALRSRLSKTRPDALKVREIEGSLRRAERIRNYLIQANTRLVMSIARRFADARNGFDDLLSQGIASLMHAVEKFDYGRGYRFSTYATCAVRRDLYRLVMSKKKDHQRFTTGTGEYLNECSAEGPEEGELTESTWSHLTRSLRQMMDHLDDRERFIVTYRFGLDESGKKSSYSQLGKRLGISKERVRQLANRALAKLREAAPDFRLEGLLS